MRFFVSDYQTYMHKGKSFRTQSKRVYTMHIKHDALIFFLLWSIGYGEKDC